MVVDWFVRTNVDTPLSWLLLTDSTVTLTIILHISHWHVRYRSRTLGYAIQVNCYNTYNLRVIPEHYYCQGETVGGTRNQWQ